jgi:hypothetical protein
MRKQVWYFKFTPTIIGPVIHNVKWAGRMYDPTNLPDYVREALGMGTRESGRRRLFQGMAIIDCEREFNERFPYYWRWNRIEIIPS